VPKSTLAGHPLHPMLIVAPAALIPFAFVMDAMYRASGKESYADAAFYALCGGLGGGVAAAAAGIMDYLSIDSGSEVKRTANTHALLNSGALALTAANVMRRKDQPQHTGGSLAMSALGAACVLLSGWFGGKMVYEQGMRVRGASPVASAPELEAPADDLMERAMAIMERAAPRSGPVLR